MRYISKSQIRDSEVKRLMIHDAADGVYLFEYDTAGDGPCSADFLFSTLEGAFESCKVRYGLELSDWEQIPDSPEYCQQDWIEPVRVVGRSTGNPQWGRFERLIGGTWMELVEKRR